MSTRAILHVGMPKCGSSALQAALSMQPDFEGQDGMRTRYVAIDGDGRLLSGGSVQRIARCSTSGAVVGARAAELARLSERQFDWLRCRLGWIGRRAQLLMSNEGWGNEHEAFASGRFLTRLGLEVEVVIYVRPQVEWCNSAWWQWGAWGGREFSVWLERRLTRLQWGEVASGWRKVPGVTSVRVRLLPRSIVGDFCTLVGVLTPPEQVVNPSRPGVVLRLLQRHPELRPGQHASAMDFALGRHLRFDGGATPWVVDRACAERIVASCHESNQRLMEYLEPDQQRMMREDAAWWSADAFDGRVLETPSAQAPDALELERLAAAAIGAIRDLDERQRKLERILSDVRSGRRFPWRLPRPKRGRT